MRAAERKPEMHPPAGTFEPFQVGPYWLDAVLGRGTEGTVYRAHTADGDVVALKLGARGDQVLADYLAVLGEPWPESFLHTYAVGLAEDGRLWVARELADETLHDVPLERDQVLDIFSTAARGVAWLHERHIHGWSAHTRNVFRSGAEWKIGDFGRCWVFVPHDHPVLELKRAAALPLQQFGHWTTTGVLPYDDALEHRLRLDDCAMLGGLLVEMLTGGKRWEWFFRALNKRPYCSATYPLTSDRETDRALSPVVNRAWRGDAGGAPLMANAGRGDRSVYADPLELLADVTTTLAAG